MRFETITELPDLDRIIGLSHSEPVVVYKHSRTCELCWWAEDGLEKADGPTVYKIVVQDARPLSNLVESRFSIRHESPQVIVFVDGKPVFDASHRGVTPDAVCNAVGL